MKTKIFLCIALLSLFAVTVTAQEYRATVVGTVSDQQGAVIPGVAIEVRNVETNTVTTTESSPTGNYVVPFLAPGQYTITATLEGFKRAIRENIGLRVGDRVEVNLAMEVGAVIEEITVSAQTAQLETATASKGQVVNTTAVQSLPLLGRNPFLLAAITNAVQHRPTLASRSDRPFDNGGMDNFSINGGREFSNEFLLDGAPNTGTETSQPGNLNFVPSPDATAEFKVQTNTYDAQYGRTGGGVINVSLKSGTNQIHGSLYHYFRNDKLNANDFGSNRSGIPKSAFRWNQPGLQLNGPVYLPKIYDGRNKTFFMYSWEDIRSSIPYPQTMTVATPAERAGDFSQTLQSNGSPITIYDPLTTTQAGSNYVRQPFAGGQIPSGRMDPVSLNLLNYYPLPNQAGDARGFNNLIASPNPRTDAYDAHTVRVDQVINDSHKFFASFVRGNRHEVNSLGEFPAESAPWYTHWRINHGGTFDLTSTLSPTLVNDLRVGYTRHVFAIARFGDGFDPAPLGFPSSLVSQLPRGTFPRIDMTDYRTMGNTGSTFTTSDTWSIAETMTKIMGDHAFKFGAEGRMMRNNQQSPTSDSGRYQFNKGFTQADPLRGDAASGNGLATMLLGYPFAADVSWSAAPAYTNRYYVLFLQDDWRVNGKLTLNMGIRWDYETPQSERYNQMNRGFDPNATNPLDAQVPGMNLRGGLLFTDSNNRYAFEPDRNNFQPRIGVAYQFTPKMVFRAGYGLSYLPSFNTGGTTGYSIDTTYVASTDGNLTPANSLRNPYPNGIVRPPGRSDGLATRLGNGYSFGYLQRVLPYVHQFSAGFQVELPGSMLVDASYVGSRSKALQTSKSINDVSAADLARGTELVSKQPNPFEGLLPGTGLNGSTVTLEQLLRPYPQFTGLTEQDRSIGDAWYNSFQVKVEKRMSHGFQFLAAYTLSKNLEAVGYLNSGQDAFGDLARVLDVGDAPHRLTVSGSWEMPFFMNSGRLLRTALGGWQFNGILTIQSGLPIGAPGSVFSTGVDPKIPGDQQTLDHWFNTCTLTTSGAKQNCGYESTPAFQIQPPYTLRTLSTRFPNIRDRRPGIVNVSLFKAFQVRERMKLEFRGEAFNLANTPQFGGPNTSVNSSNFGVVTPSQNNDPRNVQLALKLLF